MASTKRCQKIAVTAGGALFTLVVVLNILSGSEVRPPQSVWWKSWYTFRPDFESLGKNAQGYREYRHRYTGIVFVGLPGGTFEMGNPKKRRNERPVHKVTLSPFLIAKYEVSQAEWEKVMGRGDAHRRQRSLPRSDALPIVSVSWSMCQEFCTNSGLSLPTEAQWEYACRAGTNGPYAGTGKIRDMGWFAGKNHPVGEKLPNDFGIHDMHGNALEWCRDWFQKDFYDESAGATDPLCENRLSGRRVVRSFYGTADSCRSAWRHSADPNTFFGSGGFRPVFSTGS